MKDLYLLGIGRSTPVFIDLAEQSGYSIKGLYHFEEGRTGSREHGYPIIGSFDDLFVKKNLSGMAFILSMGDSKLRVELSSKIRELGGIIPTIIHPSAVISKFARINEGVCIGAFTHIQADTIVNHDTVILSGVNVSHNNIIGSGCFIAGGATIGAYTNIGDGVFIGQCAVTISSKVEKIGDNAYIGAGSLITKSVLENDIVAGRPAKSLKTV